MAQGRSSTKPRSREWHSLHLWQIQCVRDAVVISCVVSIVWLGYKLSVVTVPLLVALLLAYLCEPLVRRIVRRGISTRTVAALGIMVLVTLIVLGPIIGGGSFAVAQGISVARQVLRNVQVLQRSVEHPDDPVLKQALPRSWQSLQEYIIRAQEESTANIPSLDNPQTAEPATPDGDLATPDATDPAPAALDPAQAAADQEQGGAGGPFDDGYRPSATRSVVREAAGWLFGLVQTNSDAIGKFLSQHAVGSGADAARAGWRILLSTGYFIFAAFLTGFFFFFFCTGYGRVLRFWENLIPERKKDRAFELLSQMDAVIAGFVRGRLLIAGILMVIYTLAYWLAGVPAPLLLGPVIGLLAIIPYASGLGMPIATLLMWLQPGMAGWRGEWWWLIGAPILISAVAQLIDDYVLSPMILGKQTGMDTPTIVFASIAGGTLAGVYGFLLAIPAAACIKILLKEVVWPRFQDWAEGRKEDPLPIEEKLDETKTT